MSREELDDLELGLSPGLAARTHAATGHMSEISSCKIPQLAQVQPPQLHIEKLKENLIHAIELQNNVNVTVEQQINCYQPTYERLQTIKYDLDASLKYIHSLYAEFRDKSEYPDSLIRQTVDKITHDCQLVSKHANTIINDRCESTKSHKSQSTQASKSNTHVSSSLMRLKQSEHAAEVAELETQLIAERKIRKVEKQAQDKLLEIEKMKRDEIARLETEKQELKIQGRIAAAKRKSEIYAQALAEEKRVESALMIQNQRVNDVTQCNVKGQATLNSPQPVTANLSVTDEFNSYYKKQSKSTNKLVDPFEYKAIEHSKTQHDFGNIVEEKESKKYVGQKQSHVESLESIQLDTGVQSDNNHNTTNLELAQAISSAFSMNRLPPPEPFVFDGNPIKYPDWVFAYDSLIGSKQCSFSEKLHYLKRYVSGTALEVIDGYSFLHSEDAYNKARYDLKKRFGDPYTVSEAFRTQIEEWPKIDSRDSKGLRRFSDFLQQCLAAQNSITQLNILNDNRENKKMVSKLPENIARSWVREVTNYMKLDGTYPKFSTFCRFLATEADVACSPIFNDLSQLQGKPQFGNRQRWTLTTQTDELSSSRPNDHTTVKQNKDSLYCIYCDMSNHATSECGKLNWLPFKEQHNFLRIKQLCFACLNGSHKYKKCKSPAVCTVCTASHSTALHRMRTYIKKPEILSNDITTESRPTVNRK